MNPSCLEIFSLLDSLEHVLALFFALKRNFPRFWHRKPIPRTAGIPFQGPSNQRAGSPCQSCSAPASRTDRLPVGVRSPAPSQIRFRQVRRSTRHLSPPIVPSSASAMSAASSPCQCLEFAKRPPPAQ